MLQKNTWWFRHKIGILLLKSIYFFFFLDVLPEKNLLEGEDAVDIPLALWLEIIK